MAQIDELRMIARVARLYYDLDKRQSLIAEQLGLSQATVSRLLKQVQRGRNHPDFDQYASRCIYRT